MIPLSLIMSYTVLVVEASLDVSVSGIARAAKFRSTRRRVHSKLSLQHLRGFGIKAPVRGRA
jgi:hypothetical protein